MSTVVFVHGAWHGGWCWQHVAILLEQQGHQVFCPDLPGNGQNTASGDEISLAAYCQHICSYLDAADEPVILGGHSLGGLTVSQAAEERPDKVKRLVYLAAALLPDGATLATLSTHLPAKAITEDLIVDWPQGINRINPARLQEVFYHDCPDDLIEWARPQLVPQVMSVYAEALHLTPERYGTIRRTYIRCSQDHVIPPDAQEWMYTQMPCDTVLTLDSGHFPMLSQPEVLASVLLEQVISSIDQ